MPRSSSARPRLPRVNETSAGGIVVDHSGDRPLVAVIGRRGRQARMAWSLPKGHLEPGETPEDAAVREVAEETGITGQIVDSLGEISYWFVANGRRVHKTVHHYLMIAQHGELSDDDIEVEAVAWVPLDELPGRLAYADERALAARARTLLADRV
ncbi:MAG: NUDIX hydrolase [Actinobacteria bacterium]|nr:NUDIX hydrolase [Actinomycetota bacterium]MBI3687346.1 NUDIX hydrolase [Actinomycetota bacterium]